MSKATKYIVQVADCWDDDFGNYIGNYLTDSDAFNALDIHELEILSNLENINIKQRINILTKKLKKINYE